MLLELRLPWAHKFGKSVYHYVLIFLSWLDHQDTKGSEKFRSKKQKQKQKHRRRPTERLKWYSRWELLSALCPQTRKEAFFPPSLLSGMVQEQSTLILLKMEEAAEGNLVVNPFERDEARGVWALWQNTIFFFFKWTQYFQIYFHGKPSVPFGFCWKWCIFSDLQPLLVEHLCVLGSNISEYFLSLWVVLFHFFF